MPKVTDFQKRVYKIVSKIPRGKTMSYGEVARRLKTSPRAVGQALKKNPYNFYAISPEAIRNRRSVIRGSLKETSGCLLVACHRVIKADGTIGGFNGKISGKEIKRKQELLRSEGIRI